MESLLANQNFLVPAIGGFTAMALLVIVVLVQQRRIHNLEEIARPKYGFLGKPLLSAVLALAMVGGLVVTYQATQNINNVVVSAGKNVEAKFVITSAPTLPNTYRVDFAVVPSVDGVEWGKEANDKFDIYWTVKGEQNFDVFELSKTRTSTSGFMRVLRSGRYDITVDIVFQDKRFTKTQQLVLP